MIGRFFFLLFLISFLIKSITAQQSYSQQSSFNCDLHDSTSSSSSASLYTCNGQSNTCQAFLIFQSRPSYDSVSNISALFSADPEEVSMINSVTKFQSFPPRKEVIVPVTCSCYGQSYQANTTFNVTEAEGTYYYISSTTFQGLSSCSGIANANPYDAEQLSIGLELRIPIRCACPTSNQTRSGVRFLMTYSLDPDHNVPDIADRFGVSVKSVLDANGLEENPTLFYGTTILIPLPDPPSSSQTIIRSDPPANPPALETIPEDRRSEKRVFEYVGLAAACTLLVVIIVGTGFILLCRKRRRNVSGNVFGKKEGLPEDVRLEIANVDQVLKVYRIEELKEATDDFSSKKRIEGCVYYGELDGEMLAVKKMSSRDVSMEVNILMKIQHFNLIKPRGVCEDGGCFYLVFDYMKNGSLRELLSSERIDGLSQRIQIALDIANGLYYLHSFTEPTYIHKDITSRNILIDNELRGKIANFRLARASVKEESTNVVGTRGYMAPEYLESGKATPKIDVYAFGVVLLELITGRDAVFKQNGKEALLSAEVASVMEKENADYELGFFLDHNLSTSLEKEFTIRLAKLSVACLSTEAENRPNMEDVVCSLLKIEADLQKSESTSVHTSNEVSPLWISSVINKRMADIAK